MGWAVLYTTPDDRGETQQKYKLCTTKEWADETVKDCKNAGYKVVRIARIMNSWDKEN